jgi:hypothetical protein
VVVLGAIRFHGNRLVESIGSPLKVPKHEPVAADQPVDGRGGRLFRTRNLQRFLILSALIENLSPLKILRREEEGRSGADCKIN